MGAVIRYSEAFKRKLVEDVATGKYGSIKEARRRNGVRGTVILSKRKSQKKNAVMLAERRKTGARA
jgi:transposase-like protein